MRILYVIGDPAIRLSNNVGHSRHVIECARALEQLGNEVCVLTSGGEGAGEQKKAFGKARRFTPPFIANILRDAAKLMYDGHFDGSIEKAIHTFEPALIYDRHSLFHRAGVRAGRKFGIPVILEVNACLVKEAERYVGIGLRLLAGKCETYALQESSAITVVSTQLRDELVELGIQAERITVNPNGVDPEQFNPRIDPTPVRRKYGLDGRSVIGFVGLLTSWLGISNLLESARVICDQRPDVTFLIAGSGDEYDLLRGKVREYGLGDRFILAGRVPHEEIPMYVNAMDIATAPYSCKEHTHGSSIKLFEYMAAGRAIVVSKLGQMGEVIDHGVTGMLVEVGNVQDLTEKLLYLLDRPDLRRELGVRAREAVLSEYTWHRNAERILSAYERVRTR